MSEFVLDVDVLLALAWPQHEQHAAAHRWFDATGRRAWATCPISQIEFARMSSDPTVVPDAVSVAEAVRLLREITAMPGHRFWRDHVALCSPTLLEGALALDRDRVVQAYLMELARRNEAVLATLDPLLPGLAEALGLSRQRVHVIRRDAAPVAVNGKANGIGHVFGPDIGSGIASGSACAITPAHAPALIPTLAAAHSPSLSAALAPELAQGLLPTGN